MTGRPGAGKSSLAYLISRELRLGRVLRWPITTRSTLRAGLYEYDVIGRAQDSGRKRREDDNELPAQNIGDFIHLGPLGTALLPYRLPRVLLVDELDKSDIDLPNDLLNVFEEGEFTIPELIRLRHRVPEVVVHTTDPGQTAAVRDGQVKCHAFPLVVITSNGERDFPAAFLRRCLRLNLPDPDGRRLAEMVAAHFVDGVDQWRAELVAQFRERSEQVGGLATDQLLNAVHLASSGAFDAERDAGWSDLLDAIWHQLSATAP
ncbi:MAG: AAA family ATPase [Mycobacteriales bacterium]